MLVSEGMNDDGRRREKWRKGMKKDEGHRGYIKQ